MNNRADQWDRREFLRGAALAGTTGLVGLRPGLALAEPPPETTTLRVARLPGICEAPAQAAEELLQSEGFSDIHYVGGETSAAVLRGLASGDIDLAVLTALAGVRLIDAGNPLLFLAGSPSA
jgi:NitT/TauT family transport system substrate-binding protein